MQLKPNFKNSNQAAVARAYQMIEEKNEYDYADGWLVKDDEVVEEETPPKKKRTHLEVDELDVAQYVLKYKKYRKLVAKHRPEIIGQN